GVGGTRSQRGLGHARRCRPVDRRDTGVASVLGRGAAARAVAAGLPLLRTMGVLPARRVSALLLGRPRVAAGERAGTAAHLHDRSPRTARLRAPDAVPARGRRARRGPAPDDEPGRPRAPSPPPPRPAAP